MTQPPHPSESEAAVHPPSAGKAPGIVPMTTKSLLKVAREIVPSTKPWFESAKNYAMYANQSGFYDDVLRFLGIKKQ